MKYNNYNEAYTIMGYFSIGEAHYTRVRFMEDGSEEVFLTEVVKSGDFHSLSYSQAIVKEQNESAVESVEEYTIKAFSPKGKTMIIKQCDLESFAKTYKLDVEAINSCVNGEQKTHRKWTFSKEA